MKKLFKKPELIAVIASVIVAIVMAIVYFAAVAPKPVQGEKTVTLNIVYAENEYSYSLSTDAETVEDLLKEYNDVYDLQVVIEESEWGAFITSMKGVAQDEVNGYYYTYTLNDGYANGISIQTIADGDVLEFEYLYTEYDENWNVISTELGGKGNTASYVKAAIIMFSIAGVLVLAAGAWAIVKLVLSKKDAE